MIVALPESVPAGKLVLVQEKIEAYRYYIVRLDEQEKNEGAVEKINSGSPDVSLVDEPLEIGKPLELTALPISSAERKCSPHAIREALAWLEMNYGDKVEPVQGPLSSKKKGKKVTDDDVVRMLEEL